jgi:hypothetical protein
MIASPHRTVVLSSLGWVEGDAVWVFDVPAARTETIPLGSGAEWVSLQANDGDRFSVVHHFRGARFEVTVRDFSAPTRVLARATVEAGRQSLFGDMSVWADVPRLYTAYLHFAPWTDFVLVRISPAENQVTVQRFEWYDERYDKDYQGVVGVLELPGDSVALVSVQRSSQLILHDLETGNAKRAIALRDRGGNPRLELRRARDEVWASDYDTLVILRRSDWRILRSVRLQGADAATQQFIGDFSFAPDAELCLVARPFSGDVVAVDTTTLRVVRVARVGGQPLEVASLGAAEVAARDWKTGAFLRGTLERP